MKWYAKTAAAPAAVSVSEQCANGVHFYDEKHQVMLSEDARCVNCHRCVATVSHPGYQDRQERLRPEGERQLEQRGHEGDL